MMSMSDMLECCEVGYVILHFGLTCSFRLQQFWTGREGVGNGSR